MRVADLNLIELADPIASVVATTRVVERIFTRLLYATTLALQQRAMTCK